METVYLDTHVVVWLMVGAFDKLSIRAKESIQTSQRLFISPMVGLELQFLYEIGRVKISVDDFLNKLRREIGLEQKDIAFKQLSNLACQMTWTRDPFDRLITAQAVSDNIRLITKDESIRTHCDLALW